jgi:hypothetical protein
MHKRFKTSYIPASRVAWFDSLASVKTHLLSWNNFVREGMK